MEMLPLQRVLSAMLCSFLAPRAQVGLCIWTIRHITLSCSDPLRFEKPKEHFGNSNIKSRYLQLVAHVSKLTLWSEVIFPRRGLVEGDRAGSLSSSVSAQHCDPVPAPVDKHSSFWQGGSRGNV